MAPLIMLISNCFELLGYVDYGAIFEAKQNISYV
jgi:hypothetical protein